MVCRPTFKYLLRSGISIVGTPANIGLQRTSACGLAAEAGSFGCVSDA
jgi:hypothetical protein